MIGAVYVRVDVVRRRQSPAAELTIAGLASGVTGAFTPATLMSGGNSTLTITIPYDAPAGDMKFTVTATGAATHSASGTLTITAPPPDQASPLIS